MPKDLSNYRKSYEKQELLESNCPENTMELFQKWFYEIDSNFEIDETNAMTLSTMGLDGYPKSRVVLLKRYTYEGFIFYLGSKALLSIAASVSVYTETVGRARAAAELTRMGYHVEAKRLMLGDDLS